MAEQRLTDEQLAQLNEVARTWDTNLNKRLERADAAMRHLPALLAELEAVTAERDEARRLLEGLTPGGSEFYDRPERCAQYADDEASRRNRMLVEAKAALAAEREAREKADELAATRLQWQRLAENRLWELTQLQKQLATEQARRGERGEIDADR